MEESEVMNEEKAKPRYCIGCHKKLVNRERLLCGRCRLRVRKFIGLDWIVEKLSKKE